MFPNPDLFPTLKFLWGMTSCFIPERIRGELFGQATIFSGESRNLIGQSCLARRIKLCAIPILRGGYFVFCGTRLAKGTRWGPTSRIARNRGGITGFLR